VNFFADSRSPGQSGKVSKTVNSSMAQFGHSEMAHGLLASRAAQEAACKLFAENCA